MELVLVRCGEAEAAPGVLLGQSALPLSASGFAALERLAAGWIGPPPRLLFCSDLRRAQQGAKVLAARFSIDPLADARLRALDLGQWNGGNFGMIAVEQSRAWSRWNADWISGAPPGGESWIELTVRVRGWLAGLTASDMPGRGEQRIVALTHESTLRALLAEVLELAPLAARRLRFDPAFVSAIRLDRGHFEVSYLNAPLFLPP